jgi:putative heme-binding domain-containing protein
MMIESQLPKEVRQQIIKRAAGHADAQVRDLFERFLPDSERQQRLIGAVQPAEILALHGDPERGRRLMIETTGVQCKNCHRLAETGVALGPDLSAVGKKYNRQQLLESILQPSKTIDPKFVAYVVETEDGRVHTGLLAEKSDSHIVIKDARNTPIRIANDEIELLAPQPVSMMPELLLREMSAQEVADLLAYLEGLKGEVSGQ